MDALHGAVWAELGVQLDCAESDTCPTTENPLALCSGTGSTNFFFKFRPETSPIWVKWVVIAVSLAGQMSPE